MAAGTGRRLEASGLSGRGGAAFPAAEKAGRGPRRDDRVGVIVVNGMEGEPASDKDKVLLTRAPHLVLDGAQLLAASGGADRIVVCIPVGRDAVAAAVAPPWPSGRREGMPTRSEEVVRPPDHFVAGEESALAQWIDDGRSLPSFRPDKSFVSVSAGARPWSTTPRPWPTWR